MNNQDPCRGLFLPEDEEEEEENDNPQERDGTDCGVHSFSDMTGLFLQNAAPTSFSCFCTTESASADHHMYYNLMSASFELPNSTVSEQKMAGPCTIRGESSDTCCIHHGCSNHQDIIKECRFLLFLNSLASPNSSAPTRLPMLGGISEALLTRTPNVLESSLFTTELELYSGTSFPLPVYQHTMQGETSSSQGFASKE